MDVLTENLNTFNKLFNKTNLRILSHFILHFSRRFDYLTLSMVTDVDEEPTLGLCSLKLRNCTSAHHLCIMAMNAVLSQNFELNTALKDVF